MANKKITNNDGYVDLYVEPGYSQDDRNEFISINGKNYLLPKGKVSRVPLAVKKEYERSRRAMAIQRENADALLEKAKQPVEI